MEAATGKRRGARTVRDASGVLVIRGLLRRDKRHAENRDAEGKGSQAGGPL